MPTGAGYTAMMTKSFLLGLITGGTTIWWLRDSIIAGIDTRTRSIPTQIARAS